MRRLLFLVISWLWSGVNALYYLGWYRRGIFLKPSRVISIGNIQAGGTGKTPLIAWMGRLLAQQGSVCVLTRGYRGLWEHEGGVIAPGDALDVHLCGDEATLIHEEAPKVWVGVGADRASAYHRVVNRMGGPPRYVLLDDGFQHCRIRRDVDCVTVTSAVPGVRIFREFFWTLSRAHLVLWTKGDVLPEKIRRYAKKIIRVRWQIRGLPEKPGSVFLVTGVADGVSVRDELVQRGWSVVQHVNLADHAWMGPEQVQSWILEANTFNAVLMFTGKDWVRCRNWISPDQAKAICVVEMEPVFSDQDLRTLTELIGGA